MYVGVAWLQKDMIHWIREENSGNLYIIIYTTNGGVMGGPATELTIWNNSKLTTHNTFKSMQNHVHIFVML